jgi:hypothetical protein
MKGPFFLAGDMALLRPAFSATGQTLVSVQAKAPENANISGRVAVVA